ncbi:MAG: class A beta-lactamase-related serine hydrolase [Chloroflexota bacterium]|nr:class A beta-lactamase-related serine hydrolase [Chloroflexota bacterium]
MKTELSAAWPQHIHDVVQQFCAGEGQRCIYLAQLDMPNSANDVAVHADLPMPAASLVKPLLVESVIQNLGFDQLRKTFVDVHQLHPTMYPSILAAFERGRLLSLSEVCALSIISSDNSCADYLLRKYGVELVAARAQELGLHSTHLTVGYSDEELGSTGRGNISTARDIATLFRHLYTDRESQKSLWQWLINSLRNNRIPGELPDDLQVANKTGSLEGVANDAGVILGQPPLLVVIMTEGQMDTNETTLEISKLTLEICTALGIVR